MRSPTIRTKWRSPSAPGAWAALRRMPIEQDPSVAATHRTSRAQHIGGLQARDQVVGRNARRLRRGAVGEGPGLATPSGSTGHTRRTVTDDGPGKGGLAGQPRPGSRSPLRSNGRGLPAASGCQRCSPRDRSGAPTHHQTGSRPRGKALLIPDQDGSGYQDRISRTDYFDLDMDEQPPMLGFNSHGPALAGRPSVYALSASHRPVSAAAASRAWGLPNKRVERCGYATVSGSTGNGGCFAIFWGYLFYGVIDLVVVFDRTPNPTVLSTGDRMGLLCNHGRCTAGRAGVQTWSAISSGAGCGRWDLCRHQCRRRVHWRQLLSAACWCSPAILYAVPYTPPDQRWRRERSPQSAPHWPLLIVACVAIPP